MPRAVQLMSATWWRFSRYEIRDGLIGPAPGAVMQQYDPWEDYEASRRLGVGRGPTPMYQSFVKLDRQAALDTRSFLRAGGEEAVLRWCDRYGLLGLLLQAEAPLPAGRWDSREHFTGGPQTVMHSVYEWSHGRWEKRNMVPRRDVLGLEEYVADYFPGYERLMTRYPEIPPPLSPEFWTLYREPVGEFMMRVLSLSAALKMFLSINATSSYEVGPMIFEPGEDLFSAEALNELTATVGSVVHVAEAGGTRRLTREWTLRSLLACMAMMIQRDLLGGGRVYLCNNCHEPFVSSSPVALYCDRTCKNTAQKRHQRENKKKREKQGGRMT